jgi:hypothetical protein
MKRALLLTSCTLLSAAFLHAQILVSEDFEGYTSGSFLAQSAGAPWTTWGGVPGSAEDVTITTEQAFSGQNSALFTSTSPTTGGPGDIMLNLGNRTTGIYGIAWYMYIPSGNGGYFNIQHSETAGEEWGLDVIFRASGNVEFTANNNTTTVTTFPHDEWFEVSLLINLNIAQGLFVINDEEPLAWQYGMTIEGEVGMNQLGAINFYTYAGGDPVRFYIDDVVYVDLSSVNVAENVLGSAKLYPNPVTDVLAIELPEASANTVVSVVDVTGRVVVEGSMFTQQGTFARTEVNMRALPQGLYLVRIQDGANEYVHRVVRN